MSHSELKIEREFGQTDLDDPVRAAKLVKQMALELGADAVSIGNIERWEGAPTQMDPRQIMPECKSVVGMAFRVMRGSLRGIEEGTFFSNYSAMGYGGLTYLYIPMTVMNLAKSIEDRGYEAIPYGHQSDWRAIDAEGHIGGGSRPVAPGRAAPDVMVHLRIAAYLCGLGEIGYSKMFLSPQFGPRNRVGILLTDVKLEPDPIYNGPKLCNKCMACVKACPGGCIPADKTVKVKLAGNEVEWADVNMDGCTTTFVGVKKTGVEQPPEKRYIENIPDSVPGEWSPFKHKPRNLYQTGQAVCGARGCTRACMISLEARGVLQNKFKDKFRRRKPWSVNWNEEPQYPSDAMFLKKKEDVEAD
jgi:NAD-dependent dihydropyrimidine dehydrogenase PreA subunit